MTISRRAFLAGSIPLMLGSSAAEAQPARQGTKVPRVGIIGSNLLPKEGWARRAFLEGFREHGWVEGKNITIEWRAAEGKPERIPPLVRELVGLPVDIIVANSLPSVLEATRASLAIPVVVAGVAFEGLEGAGLVQSLARPGGTVTGVTASVADEGFVGKYLQLLKEAVPRISRVAYLSSPPYPSLPPGIEAAAGALKLKLISVQVASPEGFEKAFDSVRTARVDALQVGPSPFFVTHRRRIIEFAARERLPAMYLWRGFPESGGLMSYGVVWADVYRRAPAHVDKILKGAKPGDIPIEQPTKFELVINTKTAKALGVTIPQSLLVNADEIIR